jgi:hypothetical protein
LRLTFIGEAFNKGSSSKRRDQAAGGIEVGECMICSGDIRLRL